MTRPAPTPSPSVFLSYAREDDEPFVRRLYDDLVAAGFTVWFDRVSMPSRGLTFHQEIRDAIAAIDRLVLGVGPKALTSDYVTQEWQFAYFAVNKPVVPIVRLDGQGLAGEPTDVYRLLHEDISQLHAEDFRRDSEYREHFELLVNKLREPLPPVGKLVAVPELPPTYRAQPDRLKALRDMLLLDLQGPVVVTGARARGGAGSGSRRGRAQPAPGRRHHLRPEVGGLSVPGGGPRRLQPPHRRVGHGDPSADRARPRRLGDGPRPAPAGRGDSPLGPWLPAPYTPLAFGDRCGVPGVRPGAPSGIVTTTRCARASSPRSSANCWTAGRFGRKPRPVRRSFAPSKAGTTRGGAIRPSGTNHRSPSSRRMQRRLDSQAATRPRHRVSTEGKELT